jgi:pyrroline-5-carboxylate reductase
VGGYKVAIVGAGRLGTLLATRIPASYRKVIISPDRAEAQGLADEVGGVASDQPSSVRGCQLVLLTASTPWVLEIAPHMPEGALVVNMAPDLVTTDLQEALPRVSVVAAKVIGHTRELTLGTPGLVVLDHVDAESERKLTALLDGLGPVVRGEESMAAEVEAVIAQTMLEVRERLAERLQGAGLSAEMAETAIASTAPGVLWSLTTN